MSHTAVLFGKEFREKYFTRLDENVVPVNHGSYGLTPTPIHEKFLEAIDRDNSFTDRYMRFELTRDYIELLKALASFVNTDYRNLALVDNATTAVNTVLRSYPFLKGDKIVVISTGYESCVNVVKFLHKRQGIEIVPIDIQYPIDDDDIIAKYRDTFQKHRPKMALFDTVTSLPGVRFPFERLLHLCREFQVLSLVDGAHSVGLIDIDLDSLQPDFYTSNLHKWLYVPRGCAVLYITPKLQSKVHTMPISHSYMDEAQEAQLDEDAIRHRLIDKFDFLGSKTYAQISCIIPAIDFRKSIGGEKAIHDYCYNLCRKVAEMVTQDIWPGTKVLENSTQTLVTSMVNIEVPIAKFAADVGGKNLDITNAKEVRRCIDAIQYKMATEDKIYLQLFVHGHFYCRFSCQIYNHLDEYAVSCKLLEKAFHHYFKTQSLRPLQ